MCDFTASFADFIAFISCGSLPGDHRVGNEKWQRLTFLGGVEIAGSILEGARDEGMTTELEFMRGERGARTVYQERCCSRGRMRTKSGSVEEFTASALPSSGIVPLSYFRAIPFSFHYRFCTIHSAARIGSMPDAGYVRKFPNTRKLNL